jgi:peptide/nickel transport system permease protein
MEIDMKMAPRLGMRSIWRMLTGFEKSIAMSMFVILVLTVIGPWIAPQPTEKANPSLRLLPPSFDHFFGTDSNGMDVFSRVLASFRVDVAIAVIATSISVIVGSALGVLIAQFESSGSELRFRRFAAEVALRTLDVIQAFPVFIFAMVLVAIRGTSLTNIIAAIAFVNLPVFIRLVRSEILSLQSQAYTEAAIAVGNSHFRVGYRHLLPNAVPAVVVQVSVTVGFAILLTAGLSFVGAGVNPPTPELGAMIAGGARFLITDQWWPAVFPGFVLAYTVFTFGLFGETFGRIFSGGFVSTDDVNTDKQSNENTITDRAVYIANVDSSPTATPLLVVKNLSIQFDGRVESHGSDAVSNLSLQINPGDRIGIVGETGSGKSILVRSMLGILPENAKIIEGDILVEGKRLADFDRNELRAIRGTTIAPILPNPKAQLNPLVRVGNLMMAVLKNHEDLDKDAAFERCRTALEKVGISDPSRRLRQFPHELSGGMSQRVCIALSLLHNPKLLIADEPTAGLDVTVQRQVLDLLAELSNASGVAQLLVTRDLAIVTQYCTWVGVMQRGRMVEFGRTLDVFDKPQHAHTLELLAAVRAGVVATERNK